MGDRGFNNHSGPVVQVARPDASVVRTPKPVSVEKSLLYDDHHVVLKGGQSYQLSQEFPGLIADSSVNELIYGSQVEKEYARLNVTSLAQHSSMKSADTAGRILYIISNQLYQAAYSMYLDGLRKGGPESVGGIDDALKLIRSSYSNYSSSARAANNLLESLNQNMLDNVPTSTALRENIERILFTQDESGNRVPYDIETAIQGALDEFASTASK